MQLGKGGANPLESPQTLSEYRRRVRRGSQALDLPLTHGQHISIHLIETMWPYSWPSNERGVDQDVIDPLRHYTSFLNPVDHLVRKSPIITTDIGRTLRVPSLVIRAGIKYDGLSTGLMLGCFRRGRGWCSWLFHVHHVLILRHLMCEFRDGDLTFRRLRTRIE